MTGLGLCQIALEILDSGENFGSGKWAAGAGSLYAVFPLLACEVEDSRGHVETSVKVAELHQDVKMKVFLDR